MNKRKKAGTNELKERQKERKTLFVISKLIFFKERKTDKTRKSRKKERSGRIKTSLRLVQSE